MCFTSTGQLPLRQPEVGAKNFGNARRRALLVNSQVPTQGSGILCTTTHSPPILHTHQRFIKKSLFHETSITFLCKMAILPTDPNVRKTFSPLKGQCKKELFLKTPNTKDCTLKGISSYGPQCEEALLPTDDNVKGNSSFRPQCQGARLPLTGM